MAAPLVARQSTTLQPLVTGSPDSGNGNFPNNDGNLDYYYRADIIKYAVVGGILALFFIWIIFGAMHARHRVRNGKKPLLYHRWLAPAARQTNQYGMGPYPPYGSYAYYRPGYGGPPRPGEVADWQQPPPPPAYASDYGPPAYNPPQGASKVDPYQHMREPPAGESSSSRVEPDSSAAGPRTPELSHQPSNAR